MSHADWRDPANYEHLRSLDASGFAWEYLRRNPDFVRERRTLLRAADNGTLDQDKLWAFTRRWGVHLRESSSLDLQEPDCLGAASSG